MGFVVHGLVLIGTAIAQFFQQAAAFLVDLGMKVAGAIKEFLGQVAKAVKAVAEAFANIVRFVLDLAGQLIRSAINSFIAGLMNLISNWAAGLVAVVPFAFEEFKATGSQSGSTLRLLLANFILPTAAIAVPLAAAIFAVGTLLGPFGYLAAAIAGVVAAILIASIAQSRPSPPPSTVPRPTNTQTNDMVKLASAAVSPTLPPESQPSDLELRSVLDWFLFFLPAILAIIAGAAAVEADTPRCPGRFGSSPEQRILRSAGDDPCRSSCGACGARPRGSGPYGARNRGALRWLRMDGTTRGRSELPETHVRLPPPPPSPADVTEPACQRILAAGFGARARRRDPARAMRQAKHAGWKPPSSAPDEYNAYESGRKGRLPRRTLTASWTPCIQRVIRGRQR